MIYNYLTGGRGAATAKLFSKIWFFSAFKQALSCIFDCTFHKNYIMSLVLQKTMVMDIYELYTYSNEDGTEEVLLDEKSTERLAIHPQISACQSPAESGGKELEALILSASTDGLRGGLGSCSKLLLSFRKYHSSPKVDFTAVDSK
ncbi:hypothetical protein QYF61_017676, partial [Mycteria americana]